MNSDFFSFFHALGVRHVFQENPRDWFKNTKTSSESALTRCFSTDPIAVRQKPAQPTQLYQLSLSSKEEEMGKTQSFNPNHIAFQCKTLTELKQAIEGYNGCDLKLGAKNTVFCDGNPNADVMLIGEAPGAEEDEQGLPFVGRSGQLLDKMLAAIQLDRVNSVYIANIIPWRPPGNRPPSTLEIATCLPFIQQHIVLKKPKYLVLLGGVATKAILNSNVGIMRLRGQWHDYAPPQVSDSFPKIAALPTFHPAFLLRSPGQKVYAWEDLKLLRATLDGGLKEAV